MGTVRFRRPSATGDADVSRIVTGLDRLLSSPDRYLKGRSVGLVVNHTSVAADNRHSIEHFKTHSGYELKKIFAPEHGLTGVHQDMAQVTDSLDPVSGLPVTSLYGEDERSLAPDPALLDGIDNLVFDIQDVGARYYTFIYTMANCMQVCAESGTRMVVCDRPNPINGNALEGNLVREHWRSFVGQYPIPNRHGMTVGELAHLFHNEFGLRCDLTVVPMQGWDRAMWYDDTGLPWTPPSPNMPTLATATVYPGMCLIEGTRLSEGRGTTLPFEQVGAPYIHPHSLVRRLAGESLPGVFLRPQYFRPMFQKWSGQTCGGIQIHVTDRNRFKPLLTALAILRSIADLYEKDFAWRTEPYEFVADRPAIDLLYGNPDFRERLVKSDEPLHAIEDSWTTELEEFKKLRRDTLIY